jgi:hypothetical protein
LCFFALAGKEALSAHDAGCSRAIVKGGIQNGF